MAEVKWIKVTTDLFDDEKILLIENMPKGDALLVIWLKLLCLAGKQNNGGAFMISEEVPYTVEMLATIFRRPVGIVRQALETFKTFGMITQENGVIRITNWEKHQNITGLEKVKAQNRKRVKEYRERNSNVTRNVTVTLRNGTEEDKEEDKDIDIEKTEDMKTMSMYPGAPALGTVELFCISEGITVSPYGFWKTMEERGWMIDGKPVRNWKALIKSWDKARKANAGKPDEMIMAVLKQMEEEGA